MHERESEMKEKNCKGRVFFAKFCVLSGQDAGKGGIMRVFFHSKLGHFSFLPNFLWNLPTYDTRCSVKMAFLSNVTPVGPVHLQRGLMTTDMYPTDFYQEYK